MPSHRRRFLMIGLAVAGTLMACGPAGSDTAAMLEVNAAQRADLESLAGLGPELAGRILAARAQAPFRDWADLLRRVPGIKARLASRLSAQGLRVAGRAWPG